MKKKLHTAFWGILIAMGIWILGNGIKMMQEFTTQWQVNYSISSLGSYFNRQVMLLHMPVFTFAMQEEGRKDFETKMVDYMLEFFPVYQYQKEEAGYETSVESALSEEMFLLEEGREEEISHDPQEADKAAQEEQAKADAQKEQQAEGEADQQTAAAVPASGVKEEYPMDKLKDYDYLLKTFYTVDSTTTIQNDQLNADALLSKSMVLTHDNTTPQILIYHTHSQEGYVDSVPGDLNTTVVGVGDYLTQLLTQYGFNVIHHSGQYDVNDRDRAYSNAGPAIEQVLAENPSVEIVIDLHRDGVAEGTRLVTEVNGKTTARYMFFNGLSRTTKNGNIAYLPNPYIADNLSFAFQMQLQSARYYPGLARSIYLKGYRYNLHMKPKSLLVEVGAQTNTVQEAKNAMEPLADVLQKVLTGTQ